MYSLRVLEARSLKSDCQQSCYLQGLYGRNFPWFFQVLGAPGSPQVSLSPFQSQPTSPHGLFSWVCFVFSFSVSYKYIIHWIQDHPNQVSSHLKSFILSASAKNLIQNNIVIPRFQSGIYCGEPLFNLTTGVEGHLCKTHLKGSAK